MSQLQDKSYRRILIAACCLLSYQALALSGFHFSIDRLQPIDSDSFVLNDIELSISLDDLESMGLELNTHSITIPYLNKVKSVAISCPLIRENEHYICDDGEITVQHPLFNKRAKLSFHYHNKTGLQSFAVEDLFFLQGKLKIRGSKQKPGWHIHYSAQRLDLPALTNLIATEQTLLQQYPVTSGLLDITGKITTTANQLQSLDFNCHVSELSVDADQVLEDVTFTSDISIKHLSDGWQYNTLTQISGGAMYLVPGFKVFEQQPGFYLDLNRQAVEFAIRGQSNQDFSTLAIDSFRYQHGDILLAEGQGNMNTSSDIAVDYLDLNVMIDDLAVTYPVYIQPILLATNYADMEVQGNMALNIRHEQEQLSYLNLALGKLYIDDELNRFSIANLNSQIQMEASEREQTSTITWDSIGVYKLLFGAADMEFKSIANDYRVNKWQNVSLIDGDLDINTLTLDNVGEDSFKLTLDGALQPISLATFTQVMQWPLMSGTLAGSITGFEYFNKHLTIHGDIDFKVFDGNIVLSDLKIDNLFSSYSRTKTDITLSNLDLEQLTDTFTFGKIQGTLNGKMDNFTLENWQPVYFDAEFVTPSNDHRPHRISQRALENLSEIGGGLSSALSGTLLKFIPEYSYGQFGISCKLEKGVCHLGGVKETKNGFYILTRGGLLPPWVDVMGTGRSIQWDNLIDGLKQISEGEVRFE